MPQIRAHTSLPHWQVEEEADAGLAEHDGLVAVDDHAVLTVPLHGASKSCTLGVSAYLHQPFDVKIVIDALDRLLDDRPFIKLRSNIMSGCANDLDTTHIGLTIRIGTLEAGQKRVVNVNRPARHDLTHAWREDLHVAGKCQQVH